jgi:hypothetical protein
MLVTFKGQKNWCQTTRAIGHVKKRCEREFMGKELREQLVSEREEEIE